MTITHKKSLLIAVLILALGLLLAGCTTPTTQPAPGPTTAAATPQPQTCPEATPCPTQQPGAGAPFADLWAASGHAKADAPAFTHWNEETPAEIPVDCAKCHSTPGFQDYVGADNSEVFTVDKAQPIGTTITCDACHNNATLNLSTVRFPSGAELTGLGREAVCMTCHQGVASKVQVDETLAAANLADDDTVASPDANMGFINIHYYAAAVSRYGTEVKGGYEYDGKSYDVLFEHVSGFQTCTECHDPHSTEVRVEACQACHTDVKAKEDLRNIRMQSSMVDYDGDGNVDEGIADEIAGLRELLLKAMQSYSAEVAGAQIGYSETAYPYFFIDTDKNGTLEETEAAFPNRFVAWTGRLEKAAFNFQTATKDPGGYAHGGKYIIELLYDSIESLNEKIATPVDLTAAHRIDPGHFAGSEEAFRHWDEEGMVPGTCAKCHSADGLPTYLVNNTNIQTNPSNGLRCETCHNDLTTFTRYEQKSVTFPSGAKVSFEGDIDSNLCLNCHQGRESTNSVNNAIKNSGAANDDAVSDKLSFRNVHYFAAGATLFGTEVKGIYEYAGKQYNGRFTHVQGYQTCANCHDAHALNVKTDACQGCHGTTDPTAIRGQSSTVDYDGDGDVKEGIAGEVDTMREAMLAAIQAYATKAGTPIVYSPSAYPYWFVDANADGKFDANDKDAYKAFSPRLLKAAYNYQYVVKDPGAAVHNGKYVLQVMFDTITDLGGSTAGMTRPPVTTTPAQ